MLNTKERNKINEFFHRMSRTVSNISHTDYLRVVYEAEIKGEKEHRAGAPAGTRHGCTISEAARMFAVRWIFEGLDWQPAPGAILHTRFSAMYAYGIGAEYGEKIRAEFTPDEIADFLTFDYVKMIEA